MGMGATLQYGSYMLELSSARLKPKTTTVATASAASATRMGRAPEGPARGHGGDEAAT